LVAARENRFELLLRAEPPGQIAKRSPEIAGVRDVVRHGIRSSLGELVEESARAEIPWLGQERMAVAVHNDDVAEVDRCNHVMLSNSSGDGSLGLTAW